MKTIVVSGFRRFGAYRNNPSEELVKRLHETSMRGYRIIPILFDATIPGDNRGEALLAAAYDAGSSGIISLGVDSQKRGLCVERVARNIVLNEKYCPVELQNTPVDHTRPLNEELQLRREPWMLSDFQILCQERHIPTEISFNAGGFCCNHLAYQVLLAQKRGFARTMPFIFVHVPCTPESITDDDRPEFEKRGKITLDIRIVVAGLERLVTAAELE